MRLRGREGSLAPMSASDTTAAIDARFREGVTLQQAGRLAEADAVYGEVLTRNPKHFDALHMRGIVAFQAGRKDVAADLIGKAVTVNPSHAAAQNNLGAVLGALGRKEAALAHYEQAIALKPNFVDAFYNRANVMVQLGQPEAAVASYDKAVALKPDHADAYNGRAGALRALERCDAALNSIDRALALRPDDAGFHNNRGNILKQVGRLDLALESYNGAIARDPELAEAHYNRGNVLREGKRFVDALASYDRAIALQPGFAPAHNNRGNALRSLKQYDEARQSYDRAIAADAGSADAYINRGAVAADVGRHAKALADYDAAIARDPASADAHNSRGVALRELGRHSEAIASHEKAIALAPEHAEAHWALSICLLQQGNFAAGWPLYEWRWKNANLKLERRNFDAPLWDGSQLLQGKTILLHGEQGLGDVLQFCRYAALVADRGARVILEVATPLAPLLAGMTGVAEVAVKGRALPAFDFHCPFLSLPLAFRTALDTIPAAGGYLRAPAAHRAVWQGLLGTKTAPRVGLCWSGNPDHKNDRHRSLPVGDLAAMLPAGMDYICVQKDIRAEDAVVLKTRTDIRQFGEKLGDFADTAALCEQLDLVISVDTSIAHLAGALDKPVWILLPASADWRWLLERGDSPWYDSARLYRQTTPGHWQDALARVKADLIQAFVSR